MSRIAFGCLTFGARAGASSPIYKVDRQDAAAIVRRARDLGVTLFDTSDFYATGLSEEYLGAALQGARGDVVIASKVGFRTGTAITDAGLSRRHILASIDSSLRRLGTDYLDLYIVHKEDPFTELDETLQALDEVVRAGKARYIGFSNWSAWRAAIAHERQRQNGWARFCVGQVLYSLLQRDAEYELLPFMEAAGIGAMAWSPLAGGFLTGKYDRDGLTRPGSRVATSSVPYDYEQGLAVVAALKEIAAGRQCTVPQAAIAWALARPVVSTAVLGASRLDQLDEVIAGGDVSLTKEEIARLEALSPLRPIYPHWHIDSSHDKQAYDALGMSPPRPTGGPGRHADISSMGKA